MPVLKFGVYLSHNSDQFLDSLYISVQTMENRIKKLERQGSSVASEVELERLKSEQALSVQMNQRWLRLSKELHQFCVEDIPVGSLAEGAKSPQI